MWSCSHLGFVEIIKLFMIERLSESVSEIISHCDNLRLLLISKICRYLGLSVQYVMWILLWHTITCSANSCTVKQIAKLSLPRCVKLIVSNYSCAVGFQAQIQYYSNRTVHWSMADLMVVSMFKGCSFIDSPKAVHIAFIWCVVCTLLQGNQHKNTFHVTAQYPASLFFVLCWIMLHGFLLGCHIYSIVSDTPAKWVSLALPQLGIV
jgi:hypothetical protein